VPTDLRSPACAKLNQRGMDGMGYVYVVSFINDVIADTPKDFDMMR
jgi:hypothetical protein